MTLVSVCTAKQENVLFTDTLPQLTEEKDWNKLIIESSSLCDQWDTIAGYLGLEPSKIAGIKRNNPNDIAGCWNGALLEWIRQNYDTKAFGEPSWRTFLKAVALVNNLQFKKLAANHQGVPSLFRCNNMNSMIGFLFTVKDRLPELMEASATESGLNVSRGELMLVTCLFTVG